MRAELKEEDQIEENVVEAHLGDENESPLQPRQNGMSKSKMKALGDLLYGESLLLETGMKFGQTRLTNYRIMLRKYESEWLCIPIKSIEIVEYNNPSLRIQCKDVKTLELTFKFESQYRKWETRLPEVIGPLTTPLHAFGVQFYSSMNLENIDLFNTLKEDDLSYEEYMQIEFNKEFERLGYADDNQWRISNVNENYTICETYPRHHILPVSFQDADLHTASYFRVNRRFPSPVWRHKNGAVLARSSQPSIGIFSNRCALDERLLECICQTRGDISGVQNIVLRPEEKKLLVVDCRPFTSAFANRIRGGGYENIYNYKSSDLRHMNIPNIHSVQNAYSNLRSIFFDLNDDFKRLTKNEDWQDTISNIIFSAMVASDALEECRPVLVHCSDGWDRTPQITSLTAMLLDPYYRTIRGFQTLVEREFVDFGHKFGERNDVVEKTGGEKCPIFLQFLECVYQLMVQFPEEFEFNNVFLMKLGQHIYSNLFGDFLFNSSQERKDADVRNRLFSVWTIFKLDRDGYLNILYNPNTECQSLRPSAFSVNLEIWKTFYTWFKELLPNLKDADGLQSNSLNNSGSSDSTSSEDSVLSDMSDVKIEKRKAKSFNQEESKEESFAVIDIDSVEYESSKLKSNKSSSEGILHNWEYYSNLANPGRFGITCVEYVIPNISEPFIWDKDDAEDYCDVKKKLDKQRRLNEIVYKPLNRNGDENIEINGAEMNGAENSVKATTTEDDSAIIVDGLNFIHANRERILFEERIKTEKDMVSIMQTELRKLKELNNFLVGQHPLNGQEKVEDQQSLPESVGSGSQGLDSAVSDSSWEAVEATENPANWTPDHAASYCMDCQAQFWTGLRKHHCRVSSK